MSWYYTVGGTNYNETGGTAQIVSRFASGLIESLTITNPVRGSFTQSQLNTANGGSVTLMDAQEITFHNSPAEDQWCYSETLCSSYTDEATCYANGCYWYGGSCHSYFPSCEILTTQSDCENYNCYWCDGVCQGTPCGTPDCGDYTDQYNCEANSCYWWNDSCHSTSEPTGCESYTTEGACIGAGCHWYPFPNPIGESSCHSKEWYMSYLPYIAVGAGGLVVLALLFRRSGSDTILVQ